MVAMLETGYQGRLADLFYNDNTMLIQKINKDSTRNLENDLINENICKISKENLYEKCLLTGI